MFLWLGRVSKAGSILGENGEAGNIRRKREVCHQSGRVGISGLWGPEFQGKVSNLSVNDNVGEWTDDFLLFCESKL